MNSRPARTRRLHAEPWRSSFLRLPWEAGDADGPSLEQVWAHDSAPTRGPGGGRGGKLCRPRGQQAHVSSSGLVSPLMKPTGHLEGHTGEGGVAPSLLQGSPDSLGFCEGL